MIEQKHKNKHKFPSKNFILLFFYLIKLCSGGVASEEAAEKTESPEDRILTSEMIPPLDLTRSASLSGFSSSGSPVSSNSSEPLSPSAEPDKVDQPRKRISEKKKGERSLSRSKSSSRSSGIFSSGSGTPLKNRSFYRSSDAKRKDSVQAYEEALKQAEEKAHKKTEEETRKQAYEETIQKWIESSKDKNHLETAKKIIFSYPMFIDEKRLFTFLSQFKRKHSKMIQVFVEQLALNAFPNGVKNFQEASDEFESLVGGMNNIPIFSSYFLDTIHPWVLDLPTGIGNPVDWHAWPLGDIADNIYIRDCCLFQNISLQDIAQYVQNQKSPPASIFEIGKHFDGTIAWVNKEIRNGMDEKERKDLIKKFMLVGRFLYKKSNFHGTLQIFLGLEQFSNAPSFEKCFKDKDWTPISDTMNPINNFREYRSLLLTNHNNPTFFPMFPVLSKDFLYACQPSIPSLETGKKEDLSSPLEGIGKLLEDFSNLKRITYPTAKRADPNNPIFQFIWNLNTLNLQEEELKEEASTVLGS